MFRRKTRIATAVAVVLTAAFSLPPAVTAQDAKPRHTAEEIAKAKPSGTLELTAEQISILIGGGQGRGTLVYQGKSYPFTIKGVSVGGVGVSKMSATGNVYFLEKLQDFAGMYSAATVGAALAQGASGAQFENNKGVFIALRSKDQGVDFKVGLGAINISMAK